MNRGLIIQYDDVAAYLAHEDADKQASFLNTFCKELASGCETNHHAEMQLVWVSDKLTPEARQLLVMLTFGA